MREINRAIVHCAATRPDWIDGEDLHAKIAEIRRWHQARGWRREGYHYIIDRDGAVGRGRPDEEVGAHVSGHNKDSLGICLIGGHGSSENDKFSDHFTVAQEDALLELLDDLGTLYPGLAIHGHNEYAAKACPGFNVKTWLRSTVERKPRTSPAQSTTLQATAGAAASVCTGAAAVLGELSPESQVILIGAAVVAVLALGWIARERLKKWAMGDR